MQNLFSAAESAGEKRETATTALQILLSAI